MRGVRWGRPNSGRERGASHLPGLRWPSWANLALYSIEAVKQRKFCDVDKRNIARSLMLSLPTSDPSASSLSHDCPFLHLVLVAQPNLSPSVVGPGDLRLFRIGT